MNENIFLSARHDDENFRRYGAISKYETIYNNIILIFRQYDFPIVITNVTRTVLDLGLERNQHVRVSIFLNIFMVFGCETTITKSVVTMT